MNVLLSPPGELEEEDITGIGAGGNPWNLPGSPDRVIEPFASSGGPASTSATRTGSVVVAAPGVTTAIVPEPSRLTVSLFFESLAIEYETVNPRLPVVRPLGIGYVA